MSTVVKRVDKLGRLCLPKHMRRALGVDAAGCRVEVELLGETISINARNESCLFCKKNKGEIDLLIFSGKPVCSECVNKIQRNVRKAL